MAAIARLWNGGANKTVTAIVAGLIGWATLVVNSPSSSITAQEWIIGATYLATALGVYVVANVQPPAPGVPTTPDPPDMNIGTG